MMIEAIGEYQIGGFVQIDLAAAEYVLGLDSIAFSSRDQAQHHVRRAVHAHGTTVTGAP